jgi:Tol biopolymer transport system component
MPVFGGTPRQLIEDVDSAPSLSPDGSRFAYLRWTPDLKDHFRRFTSQTRTAVTTNCSTLPSTRLSPGWSPQGNQIAWIELTGPTAAVVKILDIASKKAVSIAQPKRHWLRP